MSAPFRGLSYPLETPAPGEWVEAAPGVLWLRLPLPMTLDHVNVYALEEPEGWTLIDAGLAWSGARAAWDRLRETALGGRPVVRLVLTHHHPDHVGLAARFVREGAELWATRTAWLFARMLQLDHQDRPPAESIAFRRRAGASAEHLAAFAATEPFNFSRIVERLPLGFRQIEPDRTLTMGGRRWRVVLGGGHAPDHATFWSDDGELALTGDQVLPRISSNIGVYPTEPDADPLSDWLESCRRLSSVADESRLALPGHNDPFRGLPLRLRQLEENHHGALDRLRARLRQSPATAVESFGAVFRREIGEGEFGLALAEAVAHLNHLRAIGEAVADEGADGALRFRLV